MTILPFTPEDPVDGEYYTATNGITYQYNAETKQWKDVSGEFDNKLDPSDFVQKKGDVMTGPLIIGENVLVTDPGQVPTKLYTDIRDRYNLDFSRRVNDNVDFVQNTVSAGIWVHTEQDQPAALPGSTEFFALNEFGQNTQDFSEVRTLVFAGQGTAGDLNNPDLQFTREGDNLLIQTNNSNEFGYYVVDTVQVIGQPGLGGNWYMQIDVRVAKNRAFGNVEYLDHCSVKVIRSVYVLAAAVPPNFSESGQLWYDTVENQLSVWDHDEQEFYPVGGQGDLDLTAYLKKDGSRPTTGKLKHEVPDPDDPINNPPTQVPYLIEGDLDGKFLPISGGTVTGDLNVEGSLVAENEFKLQYADDTTMFRIQPNANQITSKASVINFRSVPGDALDGRAGVDIQVNGENPLAISNSGSYQETLAIYGYDGNAPGGRAKNLTIGAQGNINTEGFINAQGHVKGSELRTTKLTSGQNSNLEIHRGSGASEARKMLIGDNSVNFDVDIKLVGSTNKDIVVQNGTKLFTGADEIITFGGSGAFYRGAINQPDHIINRAYADALVEDGPFLPLTGGDMTGGIDMTLNSGKALSVTRDGTENATIFSDGTYTTTRTEFNSNHLVTKSYTDGAIQDAVNDIDIPDVSGYLPLTGGDINGTLRVDNGNQVALTIKSGNTEKIKFWGSGAVALVSGYTQFKDDELVTKKYVDDTVAAGGGGFTPGQKVAKDNSTGVEVGGFYINGGNLYVKLS